MTSFSKGYTSIECGSAHVSSFLVVECHPPAAAQRPGGGRPDGSLEVELLLHEDVELLAGGHHLLPLPLQLLLDRERGVGGRGRGVGAASAS